MVIFARKHARDRDLRQRVGLDAPETLAEDTGERGRQRDLGEIERISSFLVQTKAVAQWLWIDAGEMYRKALRTWACGSLFTRGGVLWTVFKGLPPFVWTKKRDTQNILTLSLQINAQRQ